MGFVTTPMDEALAAITEGRSHLIVALDLLEKRRDCPSEVELLRSMVGDLAATISRFERERDRWRPQVCVDERDA